MSEADGLGTILHQTLPRLSSLGIARGYPSMIGELAVSPLAGQLESLSFTSNELAALTTLITHAAAFPRLRRLSVRGTYEELSQAEVDALRRAVEQAFPIDELDIPWSHLLPDLVVEQQPAPAVETVKVD